MTLGKVVKAALLAGLFAGVLAAGFHSLFTEPLIDRAIEMEERLNQPQAIPNQEPVVSRPTQKLGLFAGFLLYGGAWGVLFGLLTYTVRPWFAEMSYGKNGFLLAVLLGWAVAIFPLLKYPANPPGVGEAETIGYRQELYLVFVVLSLIGTMAALWIERWVRRKGRSGRAAGLIFYTIYLAVIFLLLPSNPDPVRLPPEFVRVFRALSFSGQLLFWTVMGAIFWWLFRKSEKSPAQSS